jgi:hypothetical protein
VWARCDAEASPGRGYYYHPSRHSAGQPIVAGWAYQLVAQLGFERDCWVAPVDARRVKPAQDTNEVATEQVRALVQRLPEPKTVPIFVFDAGFDPVKLQRGVDGWPARVLVRLRIPTESSTPTPNLPSRGRWAVRAATARSSTSRMLASWPEPTREHRSLRQRRLRLGARQVLGWVASQDPADRRALRLRKGARRTGLRSLGRSGQAAQPDPQAQEAVAVVERAGRDEPRPYLARLLPQVRSRTHEIRFIKQTLSWTTPRFRHPESRPTGGPGWSWSPTLSSGWRVSGLTTEDCRGSECNGLGG